MSSGATMSPTLPSTGSAGTSWNTASPPAWGADFGLWQSGNFKPPCPTSPPPPFLTSIRLPAHRLEIDEARFLRLLAGAVSLTKTEKRRIIEAFPRLAQYQADELIEIFEEEKEEFARCGEHWQKKWERARKRRAVEWLELEREMSN